ncbi:MAG: hypothetical protein JXA64_04930 [Candidatus Fermentibacteraceae bacterium]|nr:hypothetical protein [Candidatus Fermentibacteraceae bacterium]
MTDRLNGPSYFLGGMLSIIVQTVVLRESLFGEHQAELASGVVLAAWIVGSGIGAAVGGRTSRHVLFWRLGVILMPFLGFAQVMTARTGSIPLFATVFPLGFTAGAVFIQPFAFGRPGVVYSLEALGAAAGGGLFVLLSPSLLAGEMLAVSVLVSAAGLVACGRPSWGAVLALMTIAGQILSIPAAFSQMLGSLSFTGYDDVRVLPSPYGEVVTAERLGQHAVFRGGILEATWPSMESAEATVVVPLSAAMPKSVLYIGSSPEEAELVAGWPTVDSSVSVVPDASLMDAVDYPPGTLPGDGREYLDESEKKFDLITVSTGQPLTLLSNRFYTEEFMGVLSGSLNPDGLAALRIPGGANRLHPLEAELAMSVRLAANEHFRWIGILPMSGLTFLMGNGREPDLTGSALASTLDSLGYQGCFVNSGTLPYDLSSLRVDAFREQVLSAEAKMNRDLHPECFRLAHMLWSVRTGGTAGSGYVYPAVILFLVLMTASSIMTGRFVTAMGVASAGFTGLSVEVIALVAVQAATGYSWVLVGAVTGLFMIGAALGALAAERGILNGLRSGVSLSGGAALACAAMLHFYDGGLIGGRLLSLSLLAGTLASGAAGGCAFTSAAVRLGGRSTGRIGLISLSEYCSAAAAGLLIPLVLFPHHGAVLSLLGAGCWSLFWALLQGSGTGK